MLKGNLDLEVTAYFSFWIVSLINYYILLTDFGLLTGAFYWEIFPHSKNYTFLETKYKVVTTLTLENFLYKSKVKLCFHEQFNHVCLIKIKNLSFKKDLGKAGSNTPTITKLP